MLSGFLWFSPYTEALVMCNVITLFNMCRDRWDLKQSRCNLNCINGQSKVIFTLYVSFLFEHSFHVKHHPYRQMTVLVIRGLSLPCFGKLHYSIIWDVWRQSEPLNPHGTWSLWKLRTQHGDFIEKQCSACLARPGLTAACWAHRATLNRVPAGHSAAPPSSIRAEKPQIHFRRTQPRLRGRATFLLTAATLEWISKPIGAAQKGACWLLLSKWRHLLAFVCLCVVNSFSRCDLNCWCWFWSSVQCQCSTWWLFFWPYNLPWP